MRVYAIISGEGLNGFWVHGIYTQPPSETKVEDARQMARRGYTTGTEVVEMELDQDGPEAFTGTRNYH